jgi:hypothetical protein
MRHVLVFLFLLACGPSVFAMACPDITLAPDKRLTAIVSDLHFGAGQHGQSWDRSEDFRWHADWDSFLQRVSSCGKGQVDLVIAGDALELWQPPVDIPCKGANADTACTPAEAKALARRVVDAHRADLRLIGRFADEGNNRVYFVPGNHDAALLLNGVWQLVDQAVGAKKGGRVIRCAKDSALPCTRNGWVSQPGGEIYVEHGHQIGSDVNRFKSWPDIVQTVDGNEYLQRPWGQRFVQRLFNEQEQHYPIIDNLMPESAGARYRMADRGLWKSIDDVGIFLKFNLFETSWSQKWMELGSGDPLPEKWDGKRAKELGSRLYLDALPVDDPFRQEAERDDAAGHALNKKLSELASAASDEEIQMLCNRMAIQSRGHTTCNGAPLGAIAQRLILPKAVLMESHLRGRVAAEAPDMRVFVYAHTHQYEPRWTVEVDDSGRKIAIHNTGAFQRLISEGEFLALAKERSWKPATALANLQNEDLKACYGVVFAVANGKQTESETLRWYVDKQGKGEFFDPIGSLCE